MSIFPEDVDPQFVNQGTSSDRDMKLVFPFCEVIISSDSQGKEWKVHTDCLLFLQFDSIRNSSQILAVVCQSCISKLLVYFCFFIETHCDWLGETAS